MKARLTSAVVTAALAFAGGAEGRPPPPGPLPARPLATPWPAHIDCPGFERVEVVVDERVEAVEWRGPDALSRTFAVTRPDDPKKAWEDFRLRSDALDGVGVMGSSRILYAEPKIEAPLETFRAARADEAIAPDFPLRRLDHLIVRHGRHPPTAAPRFDGGEDLTRTKFGLKVTLRCADPARLSLRWICDAASCVPRAFRDNPRVDKQKGWMHSLNEEVPGPYGRDWVDGKRRPDLERLLCARAEPADAGAIQNTLQLAGEVTS